MKKLFVSLGAIVMSASVSHAADLGVPRTSIAAAVVAPAFNWTGFYLGADMGYMFGQVRGIDVAFPAAPATPNFSTLKVGLHAGYRHQFSNNFVLGLEADIAWANAHVGKGVTLGFPTELRAAARFDGSVRATAGFAFDRTLVYATGGLAFIDVGGCAAPAPGAACAPLTNYSGVRAGWTAGAGVAFAVAPNWSVRAEYLYANYGTKNYLLPNGSTLRESVATHTIRVGASYMFTTGPSAVVARY